MAVPKWLNRDFFETALRQYEKDENLKVTDVEVKRILDTSEPTTSAIFSASVSYSLFNSTNENSTKLIVKTPASILEDNSDAVPAEPSIDPLFETEIEMYTKTLPAIGKYLLCSLDERVFFPNLIYHSKSPNYVLVFDDITDKGFAKVTNQLNFENSKLIFSKLAKLHACSMFLEQKTNEVSDYKQGLFRVRPDGVEHMLNSISKLIDEIATWPNHENYVEKFKNIHENFHRKIRRLYSVNTPTDGYNVLNHGDFHFRNMMFKTDKQGTAYDFMLVDYQVCIWGSPALDVIYALYMVASKDTLEKHREDLLTHYYDEFVAAHRTLGVKEKPPSRLDFNTELIRHGILEMIIAVCFMPYVHVDFSKVSIDDLMANGEASKDVRREIYGHPDYKKAIQELLPKYLEKGFLD
uniref:CHK kinase-like domain-containing protein n=2 Tax=Lutzomyia longipalpis TaxID=7200 RepID=A0A1B0CKG0_LUTLO